MSSPIGFVGHLAEFGIAEPAINGYAGKHADVQDGHTGAIDMRIRSTSLSLVFKAVLVGLVVYGVADAFMNPGRVTPLRYFTIQSNIILGAVTLYLMACELVRRESSLRLDSYLRGATMLAISVTGIVFHVLLVPKGGAISFQSHVLHTIVPLGFALDWLLFAPKGAFLFGDILVWMAYPVAYLLANLVVARFDGFYPYGFMDASELGYGGVALNTLFLLVAFFLLGVLYVLVDRLLGRKRRVVRARV